MRTCEDEAQRGANRRARRQNDVTRRFVPRGLRRFCSFSFLTRYNQSSCSSQYLQENNEKTDLLTMSLELDGDDSSSLNTHSTLNTLNTLNTLGTKVSGFNQIKGGRNVPPPPPFAPPARLIGSVMKEDAVVAVVGLNPNRGRAHSSLGGGE